MSAGLVQISWDWALSMGTITTIGSNLFEIAAVQLGSALQWINIARANSLSDPMLSGQNVIVIPSLSQTFSDGIGPQ
jgi:hypothetical protein